VLLVLVISYASSLRAWLQQRGDLAAARADIAQTQAEVEALEQERLRWEDPAYVQQQARARFGWVLPGEVGYRVIDSDGTTLGAPAAPSAPTEAATEPAEWYASVWGSIEAAGEVQAPTAERTPARDGVITPHGRRGERHP